MFQNPATAAKTQLPLQPGVNMLPMTCIIDRPWSFCYQLCLGAHGYGSKT